MTSPTRGRTGNAVVEAQCACAAQCPPEVEIRRSHFPRRGTALRSSLHHRPNDGTCIHTVHRPTPNSLAGSGGSGVGVGATQVTGLDPITPCPNEIFVDCNCAYMRRKFSDYNGVDFMSQKMHTFQHKCFRCPAVLRRP